MLVEFTNNSENFLSLACKHNDAIVLVWIHMDNTNSKIITIQQKKNAEIKEVRAVVFPCTFLSKI